MIYEIVFSATGICLKALEAVSRVWPAEERGGKIRIDLSKRDLDAIPYAGIGRGDICLFATSVYEGRIPRPARENFKKLSGNGARAVLIAVFGNRSVDDRLLEMKDLCVERGFAPAAAIEASAEHSLITSVAPGRPDREDIAQLTCFARKIKDYLDRNEKVRDFAVPGHRPYIQMKGQLPVPVGGDECIGCGLCAKECPTGAIDKASLKVTDPEKCVKCMRCVKICPVGARAVPMDMEKVAERMAPLFRGRKPNRLYMPRED